jgi:nucleotide-binding universal stress UspA family protein
MTSAGTLGLTPTSLTDDIQLNSILAATDFSSTSEKSLRDALAIARYYRAKLYGVHVKPWSAGELAGSDRTAAAAALKHAEQLERELRDAGHEFILREGDVWTELEKFIREARIDLVVVGTHGRTGVKKVLLASVAEEIFRHVSCPVLTVGPHSPPFERGPRQTVRPILFATDFCESCAKALSYAVSLANRRGTRLVLLHVLSPVPTVESNGWHTPEDVFQARKAIRAATLQRLQHLVSRRALALHPISIAEFGSPADTILWAAETLQAEAIIMGLQRESLGGAHLSWSTAYEVVCSAPCPVLTIRTAA